MLIASALTCLTTLIIVSQRSPSGDAIETAASEYEALLRKIDEKFIGELDVDDVSAAAMHAAVGALDDRWSYYMTPQEYEVFLERSNNRYAGIGVGVTADDKTAGMKVMYVYKGSPAETAGIIAGDIIMAVDGRDIGGIGVDEMRGLLARPIDDTVELTVVRSDGTAENLTVVYRYVFIDPVSFELIDDDIGYITLANFDAGAGESFITAVDTLLVLGARGFIFDMRSNNGGRVTEMVKILNYLLPEGEVFITVDKSGQEEIMMSDSEMIDRPAVVLVNAYSFSAAEYFAATLHEYGYAEVVGEQTTGKNRMQVTYELPGGGALHISTSQYLTKNRVSLYDAGGFTPDFQVYLTDEEYAGILIGTLGRDDDPQLQKAVERLRLAIAES